MGTKQKAHVSRAKAKHFSLLIREEIVTFQALFAQLLINRLFLLKAWFTLNIEKKL